MTLFRLSFLCAAFLSSFSIGESSAFNKFSEYRIPISNIESVSIGTIEPEDPAPLQVSFKDGRDTLIIETDNHADMCLQTLELALENGGGIVQITVHETADTLNGSVITECVTIFD